MMAGLIVTPIGLAIVLIRAFQVPGYWIPFAVGIALVAASMVRRGHVGGG
jgi:hypothetical protein